jgi:phosphoglycerate dehydrogenase-like enzyme
MNEKINVLITVPFEEKLVDSLRAISSQLEIRVLAAHSTDEVPTEIWGQTDILYTAGVLPSPEQAPNLKWIQFHFAGVDRVTRAPILHQEGIITTTLSGAHAPQMGEYILMMLLALGHKLPAMLQMKEKREWPQARDQRLQFVPMELRGSTVGIVGYGSIGREVARLLQPFGASVLAAKWDAMHPEDTGYTQDGMGDPEGNLPLRIYPFQALKSMLRECDFLVVAVPLTPETRGLIGAEELAGMKETAYLVDVSRGGVVDHDALIQSLQDEQIAGAALDVFPEEPLPEDSPLWHLPNVLISPHIAGASPHYHRRAVKLFAENLSRYLSGEPLLNRVDLERGY